jgi:hypothetical protein
MQKALFWTSPLSMWLTKTNSVTGRHYEIMYLISEKEIENVPRIINFYRGKGNAPSDSPAPTPPPATLWITFKADWVSFRFMFGYI